MTKTSDYSATANKNAKDSPAIFACFREIGIPAVAAALRCQHMPASDDERAAGHAHDTTHDTSWTDRVA
jgi:hypothetical protein